MERILRVGDLHRFVGVAVTGVDEHAWRSPDVITAYRAKHPRWRRTLT